MSSVAENRVGPTIGRIREKAKLSQAALAKKLPMSAPTISRIETGELSPSLDEIESILAGIGTDEAADCRDFLQQDWSYVPKPDFHHPSRHSLRKADELLATTASLKRPDAKAAFVKQVEFYEDQILRTANYLNDLSHKVAFVGSIAAGKSTAICSLTGLSLPDEKTFAQKMVLEAGGGGTTICEVRLSKGPHYGLVIEPRGDQAIRQDVLDFCEYLIRTYASANTKPVEGESPVGVSREIERAIRNMAGLVASTPKDESGKRVRIDPARELVSQYSNVHDLSTEVLARMKLARRSSASAWYSSSSLQPPLQWLQKTFASINNGKHSEFTIPDRIEVLIPQPIFDHPHLDIQIIDTRGINHTGERADIECHFDNDRALTVLCTKFLDAPDQSIQSLLERAVSSGVRDIPNKSILLVLARPGDAASVKDDSGSFVEDDEHGYEVKKAQIELALSSVGLLGLPICFFNAMHDDLEPIKAQLLSYVERLRDAQEQRLAELEKTVNRLVENQAKAEAQAVMNDALHRLSIWLQKNSDLSGVSPDVHNQLLNLIRTTHPRSVWASARRKGVWDNLNYYYQLGFGTRTVFEKHTKKRINELRTLVDYMLGDEQLAAAHDFLRQLIVRVDTEADELRQKVQIAGNGAFTKDLSNDVDYWNWCECRWGCGSGYRQDVAIRSQTWFEHDEREQKRELIVRLISDGWAEFVGRIRDIVNTLSDGNAELTAPHS